MIKLNSKYKPLFTSPKRYFILTGGRGSGKSVGNSVFKTMLTEETHHRILYTRWTMVSAELSIIPEFREKIEWLNWEDRFKIMATDITNKRTGSEILFRGIKTSAGMQTAALKSLQGITAWDVDEAEEVVDEKTFNKIDLSIRTQLRQNRVTLILNPTTQEHWIWKRFFENTHRIEMIDGCPVAISTHPDVCHIHSTYLDNIGNLSPSFLAEIERIKRDDHKRYQHEIIGGWLMQEEGVLFRKEELKRFRKADLAKANAQAVYGYIDVADEGEDEFCFVIGYLFERAVYITDVICMKDNIDVTLPMSEAMIEAQIIRDSDKHISKQLDYVRVESNNQGSVFIKMLRQRGRVEPHRILPVTNTTHKHTRILMSKMFVVEYVYFLDDRDYAVGSEYHRFMRGVLAYQKEEKLNKHDDAPDALSGLTTMCNSFLPHLFTPLSMTA